MIIFSLMKSENEKMPSPKKIEKEISEFLSKKFGDNVKIISPYALPKADRSGKTDNGAFRSIPVRP